MHTGNLGYRPQGQLTLAPAYDILPMLYAPPCGLANAKHLRRVADRM